MNDKTTRYECTNCKHRIDLTLKEYITLEKTVNTINRYRFNVDKLIFLTMLDANIGCCNNPDYWEIDIKQMEKKKMDNTDELAEKRLEEIKSKKTKTINEKDGIAMLKDTTDIKKHEHKWFFIKEITSIGLKDGETHNIKTYLEFGCECGTTKEVEKKESD